ncbi:hypothetical protein LVJ94_02930 [Pendulispora rubella]|uniref:Bacterial surface antigen (D15) domain-containing protein n=1 Tax=Pendulispora rubella TaxID=2741070 RepID=A0ABZ2L5I7_9BACT
MARKCGISVELPSTANGRDYRGIVGAGVTSGGTGVQLETPLVGLKLGLKEGVEVHIFGGAVGVDFWPPAIIVPIGAGRIGFDDRSSLDGGHGPMLRAKASPSSMEGAEASNDGEPPSFIGDATVFARTEGGGDQNANDPSRATGLAPTFLLSGAADVRGMFALLSRFGPGFGLDFELGFATPAGFVHGLRLEPLGLGVSLGRMGFFTATTGAGFGGITGHGPTAIEVPASARLAFDASSNVRILLDARVLWAFVRARADGAPDAPFGDEMRLGFGVRIGQMWGERQYTEAGGYFFRLEHTERLGAAYVGAALGWELGGGF